MGKCDNEEGRFMGEPRLSLAGRMQPMVVNQRKASVVWEMLLDRRPLRKGGHVILSSGRRSLRANRLKVAWEGNRMHLVRWRIIRPRSGNFMRTLRTSRRGRKVLRPARSSSRATRKSRPSRRSFRFDVFWPFSRPWGRKGWAMFIAFLDWGIRLTD